MLSPVARSRQQITNCEKCQNWNAFAPHKSLITPCCSDLLLQVCACPLSAFLCAGDIPLSGTVKVRVLSILAPSPLLCLLAEFSSYHPLADKLPAALPALCFICQGASPPGTGYGYGRNLVGKFSAIDWTYYYALSALALAY